jgi:hypothetical protein
MKEFHQYLGERSSFFIPSDIENRLQKGSRERYDSQLSRFGNLKSDDKDIQSVIDLINKHHRCRVYQETDRSRSSRDSA